MISKIDLAYAYGQMQHIAGSNLKFTDFLSRNPVEIATTEDVYDEQNVINILSEQAESNAKHGPLLLTNHKTHRKDLKQPKKI